MAKQTCPVWSFVYFQLIYVYVNDAHINCYTLFLFVCTHLHMWCENGMLMRLLHIKIGGKHGCQFRFVSAGMAEIIHSDPSAEIEWGQKNYGLNSDPFRSF